MKQIYVFLIALVTGVVGTGVGLFLGGRFGGTVGLAGGSIYGVCLATETAKNSGILTQAQTNQLLEQIKARAGSDFKLKPQQVEKFTEINCSQIMQEMEPNQEDNSTSTPRVSDSIISLAQRNFYDEINLNQLPADVSKKGNSPEELALTAFGTKEVEGLVKENVEVDIRNREQTIVIITQTNLSDDSVNSIRYRIDFKYEDFQWQMEWAGQQFVCQPGRGNQNWSKELCY